MMPFMIKLQVKSEVGMLLGNVQVPRCLRKAKEVVTKRFITFVDAPMQAYGTVVYLLKGEGHSKKHIFLSSPIKSLY